MSDEFIEFEDQMRFENLESLEVRSNERNGLKCTWSISTDYSLSRPSWKIDKFLYFSCKFEWNDDSAQDFHGFAGFIDAIFVRNGRESAIRFEAKLTHSGQEIRRRIGLVDDTKLCPGSEIRDFSFFVHFEKCPPAPEVANDDEFTFPPFIDEYLVVGGVEMSVNRTFLSMQSDYFRTLFGKNLNQREFYLDDVDYEDFKLLLRLIHPTSPIFPNDENVEILLELAENFQIPAAKCHLSHFLANLSELPISTVLRLSEHFILSVFHKIINVIDSCDVITSILESTDYEMMTDWLKEELRKREDALA